MKIPRWIKSQRTLFWIWVCASSVIVGTLKYTLDLSEFWAYLVFYMVCIFIGYALCWIQNFYRHKELVDLVDKSIQRVLEKHFPPGELEKKIMKELSEKIKHKMAKEKARIENFPWN